MANFDLMCCLAMADGGKIILLVMDRLAREAALASVFRLRVAVRSGVVSAGAR